MIKRELAIVEQHYFGDRISPGEFHVGDTIDVHVRIKEGEKQRVQIFNGVVIRRRGRGAEETFTVRRIVNEEGVERTWPLLCPSVSKIEIKRRGKVRRAKLYYLRDRKGKATKVRELRLTREQREAEAAKKATA